jgi:hypothetical protein
VTIMAGSIKAVLADIRRWGQACRPRIFISYRRHGEGAGFGGRIADKLVETFGAEQCFRDVANIESGLDFVRTIHEAVSSCEILIAVIGPDWISQTSLSGGRRLDNQKDFVRLEIAAALERDIRVIPVLVGGATMPTEEELPKPLQGLARRQAQELSDSRWEYDVEKLLHTLESVGIRPHSHAKKAASARRWKMFGASAAALLVLGSLVMSESAISNVFRASSQIQIQNELERARIAREEAEAKAAHDAELARLQNQQQAIQTTGNIELAKMETQRESVFNGLYGTLRVSWQHQGVVYDGIMAMAGPRGGVTVSYLDPLVGGPVTVDQDITFVRNETGSFYVGSAPRITGTNIPVPFYAPDIFKLMPVGSGKWTIGAVGDHWDQLDPAVVQ